MAPPQPTAAAEYCRQWERLVLIRRGNR